MSEAALCTQLRRIANDIRAVVNDERVNQCLTGESFVVNASRVFVETAANILDGVAATIERGAR